MSLIWIYVIIYVRPAGQQAGLHDKDLSIGHCKQTVLPKFFVPAMLIGTIDFCHFISLSLTLTFLWGHRVSAKQNLLASFSWTFHLIWMYVDVMKQFKLNILILLLNDFFFSNKKNR